MLKLFIIVERCLYIKMLLLFMNKHSLVKTQIKKASYLNLLLYNP